MAIVGAICKGTLSREPLKNYFTRPDGVEFGKKYSFTMCKPRFFCRIRLAGASPPTFFRGSLACSGRIPRQGNGCADKIAQVRALVVDKKLLIGEVGGH